MSNMTNKTETRLIHMGGWESFIEVDGRLGEAKVEEWEIDGERKTLRTFRYPNGEVVEKWTVLSKRAGQG